MSYTLVLEWMPGDLYMSAVTARCTAPTSSYSVVWLPPNKVYQITLYCGSTSLVSFLVGAFRGKAWSYMNQTTKETRRRSYDAVLPKRAARCRLILETLGNRELTASEITEELVAAGRIPYFNRNYVAPRLTELKEIGILTTVGRRKATRSDATEAVWARAEPSGPTGQTAAAYADNPTEAEQMTLGSAT